MAAVTSRWSPIVVREPIFVDPNSVLSDLNRVLVRNRQEIEGLGF